MSVAKLVIVNQSAGRSKYSNAGWNKVVNALNDLVKADKARDIATEIVRIDIQADMNSFNGKAVKNPKSHSQVKRAVDAVFKSAKPHYILLLGGPELIPHVPLRNPLFGYPDEEKTVPSDLPYACDVGHGLNPSKFLGATRVVGRLPDVTGDSNPNYLVKLIKIASGWETRSKASYKKYFGVTAKVWRGSTRKNVSKLFGTTKPLQISPSDAPKWSKNLLKPRMHFINCHGVASEENFYGEGANENYPLAHYSDNLKGAITEGTVIAAECCYGAELYDPTVFEPEILPICNRYLAESAYGYLGSTTIAWGSDNGLTLADLICQYFMKNVRDGASLGRAMLEARHKFVAQNAPLDPHALKTLAQFVLLGDPSVHPVKKSKTTQSESSSSSSGSSKSKSKSKSPVQIKRSLWGELVDNVVSSNDLRQLFQKTVDTAAKHAIRELEQRGDRRTRLFQKGIELGRKMAAVDMDVAKLDSKSISGMLKDYAQKNLNAVVSDVTAFMVEEAEDYVFAKSAADKRRGTGAVRFLVGVLELDEEPVEKASELVDVIESKSIDDESPNVIRRKMLVATERNGKIESNQEYFSR